MAEFSFGFTEGSFSQVNGQKHLRSVAEVLKSNKQKEPNKGPVKLIKPVKIAHSFLQSVSSQFHFIILSLPM